MATTYSKIQRNFWETDEARDMTPEEKYFWMYLQTNSNVNTLGCYVFRMRKAMDETGYNRETIEKLLEKMVQTLRILYDKNTGEVFLLNSSEIYWNKSTNAKRAITADLNEIKSKTLLETAKTMLQKHGIFAGNEVENAENTAFSCDEWQERTTKDNEGQTRTTKDNLGEEEKEEEEKEEKIFNGKSAEFLAFWKAYPNKKNKQTAIIRWDRMNVTPALYKKIMEGLERAKNSREWAEKDGKYIPHPASWLNAGGWENEYRTLQPTEPEKPKPPTGGNDALDRRRQMMGG